MSVPQNSTICVLVSLVIFVVFVSFSHRLCTNVSCVCVMYVNPNINVQIKWCLMLKNITLKYKDYLRLSAVFLDYITVYSNPMVLESIPGVNCEWCIYIYIYLSLDKSIEISLTGRHRYTTYYRKYLNMYVMYGTFCTFQ